MRSSSTVRSPSISTVRPTPITSRAAPLGALDTLCNAGRAISSVRGTYEGADRCGDFLKDVAAARASGWHADPRIEWYQTCDRRPGSQRTDRPIRGSPSGLFRLHHELPGHRLRSRRPAALSELAHRALHRPPRPEPVLFPGRRRARQRRICLRSGYTARSVRHCGRCRPGQGLGRRVDRPRRGHQGQGDRSGHVDQRRRSRRWRSASRS